MNLNKFTKAELISKLEVLKSKGIEKSKSNDKINTQPSLTIWDILNKIKILIISLSFIQILLRLFKNYKSIRAILKLANYIIVTMFGVSLLEAFGLGFLVKILGELKYIFGAVVTYLSDSTFYNYLMKMFNVTEEKGSVRDIYKKPVETDWKAEFENAERKREWEKWLEKHSTSKHDDDKGIDKKTIMLTILFLAGSLGVWYYGKEALDIISPVWNMSNILRRVLRGGRDDDDDNLPPTPSDIGLDHDSRAVSPDMLVYSSDVAEKKIIEALPHSHPARLDVPPAPPAPPAPTEQGIPNKLLEQIRKGKGLKPTETIIKDGLKSGKVIGEDNTQASTSNITSTSEGGMLEQLKNSLDKLRPMITGDDDLDHVKSGDNWDDTTENTSSSLLDKGKKVENQTFKNKKVKFLDSIAVDNDYNKASSSKIAPVLDQIKENFPNLSDETLKKLSTTEGLKNRQAIIESLSEDELRTDVTPLDKFAPLTEIIEKGKSLVSFEDLKEDSKKELERVSLQTKTDVLIERFFKLPNFSQDSYLDGIINKNIDHTIEQMLEKDPSLNKQQLVEKLIELNPIHKDLILSKVTSSIERQLTGMENMYSEKDFHKIKKVLTTEDLRELHSLGENKTIDQIKTLKAVNKSHNNFLEEIKVKSSRASLIDNNNQQFDDTMNLFD
jgi:hypothetical protein